MANALKFTTQGSFGIEVDVAPNGALKFAVSDTGIGIAPADQEFLFTRYTQVDSSSTRRYGGTGLGLAISRQLAQLMGGDITLVSELGRGSTFTVTLPLRPATPQAASQQAPTGVSRPQAQLLLVEDNDVNQIVAQRFLGMLGCQRVTTVNNGAEALHACEIQAFDLILMDCQMPVMDGWEASVRLREKGVNTPILALTASATSDERDKCLACGMDDFLSKPVELPLLPQKIERLLARAGAAAPVPSEPLVFNAQTLDAIFDGHEEIKQRALAMFIARAQQDLQRLEGSCSSDEAAFLLHRLKGGAGTIGADALSAFSAAAERANPSELAGYVAQMRRSLDGFVAQVNERCSGKR